MKRVRRYFISGTGSLVFGVLVGCAPSGDSPAANPADVASTPDAETSTYSIEDAAESSSIYIGSDRYYFSEARLNSKSNQKPTQKPASGSAANQKSNSQPSQKPTAKPVKNVDVEFVLTKSKEISVGLASDSPKGRIQNDDVPFIPASITKVLTAAVALRNLGPDFKFKTRVGFDWSENGQATNLVIYADGDPTMGKSMAASVSATRMLDIVTALKQKGVRSVSGEMTFVSADPRVDDAVYARGIAETDAKVCFGAMASTFNFNSNCAQVKVNAKTGFRWEVAGVDDFLKNSLDTQAGDRTSLTLSPLFSDERVLQGFVLRGTYIAKAPATLSFRLPVANPAGWYFDELVKAMRVSQIAVTKPSFKFARGAAERSAALGELARQGENVSTIESPPLSALAEAMNKHSDNFLADSLFKTVGSKRVALNDSMEVPSSPILSDGEGKIREALDTWLGADGHKEWANELSFYEGAGLSTDNRATPRAFLAVMRRLSKEPTFPTLWNSLPIAGVDGTLGERMKRTSAAGKVRGKTGTLNGSYQLVGFIPKTRGGTVEYVPFVILTSTERRNRETVRRFQDAVVAKMYETINSDQ